MIFEHNDRTKELIARVEGFMDAHIYPNEATYAEQMDAFRADGNPWQVVPILEELKEKAKALGKKTRRHLPMTQVVSSPRKYRTAVKRRKTFLPC